MYLLKGFAIASSVIAAVSATDQNLGCKDCHGSSPDQIRLGCLQLCDKAFNPSSSEHKACRDGCTDFVFDHHCCTGSCSADANTCMSSFFPPASKKRDDKAERGHARDFSSSLDGGNWEYGAVVVRDGRTDVIEARVDLGNACCKAATTILASSALKIIPLIQGQRWDDDTAAGLILVAFGLASGYGCQKAFGTRCLFPGPQGVGGPVAGGPLPPG